MQQVGDVNYVNRGAFSSCLHMYRTEGVRGLWKSNILNCALAAPFSAFEFFFYEFYKSKLFGDNGGSLSLSQKIAAGAITGITAQGLIYPGDVVKTHYITATNKGFRGTKVGVWIIAHKVMRNEGFGGFWKGGLLSCLGCGPFVAIRMSSYDSLMTHYKFRLFTKQ